MPGSGGDGSSKRLPELPIVELSPMERRSQSEKYGSFFYLSLAGLALLLGMIGWFSYSVWALRSVWTGVYVLHDARRPEAERVAAAWSLARDPGATPRQLADIALEAELPPLARYVVAEGLGASAVAPDPHGYARSVAGSEGWPGWLRVLLVRPLAYAAGEGEAIAQEPMRRLAGSEDPILRVWALYTLAASSVENREERAALETMAGEEGANGELARMLVVALGQKGSERSATLDRATVWLRSHLPEAAGFWKGWEEKGGQLVKTGVAEG